MAKGSRYLTLVGDHTRGCVVWGTDGAGQAAADEFFAALDPPGEDPTAHAGQPPQPPPGRGPAIMVPLGPGPTVPDRMPRPLGELSLAHLGEMAARAGRHTRPFVRDSGDRVCADA